MKAKIIKKVKMNDTSSQKVYKVRKRDNKFETVQPEKFHQRKLKE